MAPEMSDRAADALLDFMLLDAEMRGDLELARLRALERDGILTIDEEDA